MAWIGSKLWIQSQNMPKFRGDPTIHDKVFGALSRKPTKMCNHFFPFYLHVYMYIYTYTYICTHICIYLSIVLIHMYQDILHDCQTVLLAMNMSKLRVGFMSSPQLVSLFLHAARRGVRFENACHGGCSNLPAQLKD